MSIELFRQLGDNIEASWLAENYNEERLPEIAKEALLRADIPSKTDPWTAVAWALEQRDLPRQHDPYGQFGEPPITLYRGPRFHIDIYFWFTSTTTLHQHAFCGAFQVFEGASLHSWYEFERDETINMYAQTGRLDLKVSHVLEKGAVQEIWPGRRYIHALYHLNEPSVTIVVRTHKSLIEPPQFDYYKPGLAIDPTFEHETITKKIQLALAMLRAKRPDGDAAIAKLLRESDLHTSFVLLSAFRASLRLNTVGDMFGVAPAEDRIAPLIDAVIERHGPKAEILRPVFEFRSTQDHFVALRQLSAKPEHRFLFALLMNLDDREHILQIIRERYPDEDPVERVLDWVFDMSNTRIAGKDNENALGITDFGEAEMFALEGLLRGRNDDEIAANYAAEAAKAGETDIPNALEKIRGSVTFRPLLA
ncbi:MAG TPA: hypothetical protein VL501_02990 [Pyrinomonadaceae bacterium]|nr:hypothetical protein [Pyrinomonadaceae bacterium]